MPGDSNIVYLLGSVHALRWQDYPLPKAYTDVYQDSDRLVMEIDLDDLDIATIVVEMMKRATDGSGPTIGELFSEEERAQMCEQAGPLGQNPAALDEMEPWFVGMQMAQLQMKELGFHEGLGIEMHYLKRAYRDKKTIDGLETFAQQLDFFDTLPVDVQKEFLEVTFDDIDHQGQLILNMVDAWRAGDAKSMERYALEDFEPGSPLYDVLLVNRNRSWIAPIKKLLDSKENYLVIVGSMHLVGDDSVVKMLRDDGLTVTRYQQN
ncbi:MAG: TraB/GumN family protein [Gammaproteobacteria bacterium]|nr:TraB/GumN family protein [Gammaproteobacteria bacterium]